MAYINAVIKKRGHETQIFDVNLDAWLTRKDLGLWDQNKLNESRNENRFNSEILPILAPQIKHLCKTLVLKNFDAVGFALNEINLLSSLYCIRFIKTINPDIKIFCGGPEVYFENKRLMSLVQKRIISAAIFGEAEETVDELLSCWEKNVAIDNILGLATPNTDFTLKRLQKRAAINFAHLPLPDFSDFKLTDYKHFELPIMMSRGCVATCTFCTEFVTWKSYKVRGAEDVFKEIVYQIAATKTTDFYFCDSLINGNHELLKQLVDLIIDNNLQIQWTAFARVDDQLSQEIFYKLKKSGCKELRFGLESGSNKILDLMNKNNNIETANKIIKFAFNAGVKVHGLFIVAFPGESRNDFFQTQKFIFKNRKYLMKASVGNTLTISEVAPMSKRPKVYGIKTTADGSIYYDENGEWFSVDGSLDPLERYHRLTRMHNFLDSIKLNWDPIPSSRLEIHNKIDRIIAYIKIRVELFRFLINYFFSMVLKLDNKSS
jgi:hypothetical protein